METDASPSSTVGTNIGLLCSPPPPTLFSWPIVYRSLLLPTPNRCLYRPVLSNGRCVSSDSARPMVLHQYRRGGQSATLRSHQRPSSERRSALMDQEGRSTRPVEKKIGRYTRREEEEKKGIKREQMGKRKEDALLERVVLEAGEISAKI